MPSLPARPLGSLAVARAASRAAAVAAEPSTGGTREAILAVAARLFADRGYHRTSLHGVAALVGVQKASLFHHFASKEALYRAVLQASHGQAEATLRRALSTEGGWLARVRALVDAYVDLVAEHPEQTKMLLRQSLGDAPDGYDGHPDSDRLIAIATTFLADGQRAGAFASCDALALVLGIAGTVTFLFTSAPVVTPRWAERASYQGRVELIRRHVMTIVLRTLAPAPREPDATP